MFEKILIANRGEIAVRVIRTCRELGIKTVAVYSDLDRDALHVQLADEAYSLGGQTAAETYLNTDAIIDAVVSSGAQAVHPGYGFFSENADFARAITSQGITFIGPPPEAIEVMGDKMQAREAVQKVGVAGVPGTTKPIESVDEVTAFGDQYGWPVALKAAYGGGGRGMKVVYKASEAADALESAKRESKASFGRDEMYMERYLEHPRHVEMQVFADSKGNAVWIGERDCSCQRRHQKLIEESPAPDFPDDVRERMGAAAIKVAKACNYTNAGTIEFLYQDGEFYFLEMNTRLQVEHPVTEEISGFDLVHWQLIIADGGEIPVKQEDIVRKGHAIEVRINAEDPKDGKFMPSPGTITKFRQPSGPGVRLDAGYGEGDTVSQFYDNLVAKLIVWAPDREAARRRMLRAIEETTIEGIATTLPAHQVILEHPDFVDAKHSTVWVEKVPDFSTIASSSIPSAPAPSDTSNKVEKEVDVEVNGKRFVVKAWVPDVTTAASVGKKRETPSRGGSAAGGGGSNDVTIPMQGTVVKVLVSEGDQVEAGQAVCVLEAMKMENNINAERSGTVTKVSVSVGQSVGAGDPVCTIE